MIEKTTSVNTEGDVLGVAGSNYGSVNITYISQTSSDADIHARKLILGSPYLGLSKFEETDSSKFFGRDIWINELVNHLQQNNVLLLLGASGSGKSSLIRAGLIPTLKNQPGYEKLVNLTFVPDVNPFESLYGCLLSQSYKQSQVKLAQTVAENTLIDVVKNLKQDSQWLIFIDQFEELFTITPAKERDVFIKSLIKLIDDGDNSVKIILTMRADFLDKLSPYPKLGKIHDVSGKMLTDMENSELRLAIAEPAARNGVTFEQGLIEQIIEDFHQQAGSLPLLQFTLNELWKKDDIEDRVLNQKTYQDLGGVSGALQKQANKIYNQFNQQERKIAENIFIKLIGLERKEPVSKRADIKSFEDQEIQKVLFALIDNRLLVSQGKKEKATVEVAHEELLHSWQVLQDLIRDKEEIIILGNRLSTDAKQWDELRKEDDPKAKDELWSGSKLARIIELEKEQSLPNLDAIAQEFIHASQTQAKRQKNEKIRTARIITAGSLVAVVISSSFGFMAWKQTKQAELNQAESLGRYSLSLFNEGKELDAFVIAIKAGKILQKQQIIIPEVTEALHRAITKRRERNRLEGHNDSVKSVSFSPDGKTLVSGSSDNTIKLWDVETGQEIRTFTGHTDSVNSVSFSPDGKTLVSGSRDKTIKLWDVETGKEICTLIGHDKYVRSVAFSSDGKTLVSGSSDNTIKLWNVETGKKIRTFTGHTDPVNSVSFSLDGKTLASGSRDKTIKLWDVETGKGIRTFTGHTDPVNSVSFSLDGKTLISGSFDNTIKLWNVETGKGIRTFTGHTDSIRSVIFSSDGKTLASGSFDKTIKLWNVETGKQIHALSRHDNSVRSVAFSSDGKTLASGSFDKTIKLWNLQTGNIRTLTGHEKYVRSVSFSPDSKTLASGSRDKTIKLWNVETGKEIRTLTGHTGYLRSVSFSPDGKTLASGSRDKTIKLWNVETGKEIRTLTGHEKYVRSVSFSPDGKTLVSGSYDHTIKLWNVETGKEIRTLTEHNNIVYSVNFSPDGKTLVSGSRDNTIKLWNVETRREIFTLTGHDSNVYSVNFSPDGKTLASGSRDNTIKLWNVETRREIFTLTGHDNAILSVSFSHDSKTLASGSYDNTIKLWNVETGKKIRILTEHNEYVNSVSFSHDGKTLASGSFDNTIKLWNLSDLDLDLDLDLDYLMAHSCDWIWNYLQNSSAKVKESDRKLCDGIGTEK